jgi:hypothetical protein
MDLFALLGHVDLGPVFYGLIMFAGIWSMWHKLTTGNYSGFVIELGVFVLVFKLHGGSMAGGFAAMICALLAGAILGRRKA